MYRLLLTGILLVGALSGFVERGTHASFTSAASVSGNTFTTGSIALSNQSSSFSTSISLAGMMPGAVATAPLTVRNDGTITLTYALASTVTNADGKGLGAQLQATIKTGVSDCSATGFSLSGTTLYGPAALGSTSGSLNLIGTTSTFPNSGRNLTPSSSETLCIQVSLPTSTADTFANATTTVTLNFVAHQTSGT